MEGLQHVISSVSFSDSQGRSTPYGVLESLASEPCGETLHVTSATDPMSRTVDMNTRSLSTSLIFVHSDSGLSAVAVPA